MNFHRRLLTASLIVAALATGPGLPRAQERQSANAGAALKLAFANDDLKKYYKDRPYAAPLAVPGDRWLVTVGDMLYMVGAQSRIAWEFSVEPNVIFDVAVDSKGIIYVAVSDGLLFGLNDAGRKVWSNFMNGSANYTQLKAYRDGMLVLVSMEGYRQRGSNSDDILEFWQGDKSVWRKEFPRHAKLEVSGDRIIAVKTTEAGKEIRFIE